MIHLSASCMRFAGRSAGAGLMKSAAAKISGRGLLVALSASSTTQVRFFAKLPGPDPLEILRKESLARNLCDEDGFRRPGVHWVISLAVSPDDIYHPPNLRTVGVQRVSESGIDFVVKRGAGDIFVIGRPVSVLHTQGKYVPGESAEQWRGEGHVEPIALQDLLQTIPHYTITNMIASKRIEKELEEAGTGESEQVSQDRHAMQGKSHVTEVVQKTRLELENGEITEAEMNESMRAMRFCPDRMECLWGGPESIMWERWEWSRAPSGDCPEGSIPWNEPKRLLMH